VGLRCRVENGRTESYSPLRSVQESSFASARLKSTLTTDHCSVLHRLWSIRRRTRLMRSQGCQRRASVARPAATSLRKKSRLSREIAAQINRMTGAK
jgi:hypothetical protein